MASKRLLEKYGCDCWCQLQTENEIFWQGRAKTRGCKYCGFVLGAIPQKYCRYDSPNPKYEVSQSA